MKQESKIVAVKILGGGESVVITLEESGNIKRNGAWNCSSAPHPDFLKAVDSLRYHIPVLTDFVNEKDALTNEDLKNWTVTGYAITGKEGSEKVQIKGFRRTHKNRPIPINTPPMLIDQNENDAYPFMDEIKKSIKKIVIEARQYLSGEKLMPDNQGQFEFDNDKSTHAKVLPPMTALEKAKQETIDAYNNGESPDPIPAKKGGKKKVEQTAANPSGEVSA